MGMQKKNLAPRIDKKHADWPICGRTFPQFGKMSNRKVKTAIKMGIPQPKTEQQMNFILSLPFLEYKKGRSWSHLRSSTEYTCAYYMKCIY